MGLTVHYQFNAGAAGDAREAHRLVETARQHALALQREGRVDEVLEISDERENLDRFATAWLTIPLPGDSDTSCGVAVNPEEGVLFPVTIGEDCEPLWLGLCRYPRTVLDQDKTLSTGLGRAWRFSGACKTQYAGLHGWEYFSRCHTAVIDLLARWRTPGVRVKIDDEGGYWPRRSLAALHQRLDEMNGLVAAMAGALKDSADEAGEIDAVESPIFQHAQFEKIEAEGVARHGKLLRRAVAAVRGRTQDAPGS